MLRPVLKQHPNLQPEAYFYDAYHQRTYYLHEGFLYFHDHITDLQQPIPINQSGTEPINLPSPFLVTIDGDVVSNSSGNIIAVNGEEATIRSSCEIYDGSYWQWHAPLALSNIQLGICITKENEVLRYQFYSFNSSTSRTVSFHFKQSQLSFRVNGIQPNKKQDKSVKFNAQTEKVYPCAKLKGKGNSIVFIPFITTPLIDNLFLNPLGPVNQEMLTKKQIEKMPLSSVKIRKLIQLCQDRMLLIWENNKIQLIQRDSHTKYFNFPEITVQNNQVYALFTQKEYQLIKQWRGQKELFEYNEQLDLSYAYEWIKELITTLLNQQQKRKDLLNILFGKLLALRPYLHSVGITVPNPILHFCRDKRPFLQALTYFQGYNRFKKDLLDLDYCYPPMLVKGDIKEITSNYLLSKKDDSLFIYHLSNEPKIIFHQTLHQKDSFCKRTVTDSYQETDLRYLEKDGSYIYKILSSSLNNKKKEEQNFAVNENDVRELMNTFNIEETMAQRALQTTGNIQEALVWIYSDHTDKSQKKQTKKEGEQKLQSISMIQLKTHFTRLLIANNKKVFVICIRPFQLQKWISRGQNQFVDLTSFKHQNSLDEIHFEKWYQENHPSLYILDYLQCPSIPKVIYQKQGRIYVTHQSQNGLASQEITFDKGNLYESRPSLTLSSSIEPIKYNNITQVIKTVNGELLELKPAQQKYQPNTTVLLDSKVLTNVNQPTDTILKLNIKTDSGNLLDQVDAQSCGIPLTIEYGPPGVNKNYSISNVLLSNTSFLANYPHGLRLSHLHNLLMQVRSLRLKRCINRKNINNIIQGVIILKDYWDNRSETYPFKFGPTEQEVTIDFKGKQFWKQIYIEPEYTSGKKLPFQIGSISAQGHCISADIFLQDLTLATSKIINQVSSQHLFVSGVTRLSINHLQVSLSTNNKEYLRKCVLQSEHFHVQSQCLETVYQTEEGYQQLASGPPQKLLKYLTANSTKLARFTRFLAKSSTFCLDKFEKKHVRKFTDLFLYSSHQNRNQGQCLAIFNKIWNNSHGKDYLLNHAQGLCDVALFSLPFLKIMLSKLSADKHHDLLGNVLKKIQEIRSRQYHNLSSEQAYLYYQTDFFSNYYLNLIEPPKKVVKATNFSQSLIKCDIAVFRSQFSRRIVLKLPTNYVITNTTLRIESCQGTSKVHYSVYSLNNEGKKLRGSGVIKEHQWIQLTSFSTNKNVEEIYGEGRLALDMIGLKVETIETQYLEIQLNFTQTGVTSHDSEHNKYSQIGDIIPQLYGYEKGKSTSLPSIDSLLSFNPQDMFFLSVCGLSKCPLKKYSISKGKSFEFIYFTPQKEDFGTLKMLLQQKIEKKDYESIVNLQKRLISHQQFSQKVSLDYLYTLTTLSLFELQKQKVKVEDSVCDLIFSTIVEVAKGPIKILAFKAISHKIKLLIKSLQYIDYEMASMGPISFSYEQLVEVADFHHPDLCKSLTRLILTGVPYEKKWNELLIKMSPLTQSHQQIIDYFINESEWLQNSVVLNYLASLPDQVYMNHFLDAISYKDLCKLVLNPLSKLRVDILLQVIVDRASDSNPVDLDVVSLIFQQRQIKWQQLQRVISSCLQATDVVIHQFLQSSNSDTLALQHTILLATAASPKYAEEFAVFLEQIYQKNKKILPKIFQTLRLTCTSLHYDLLQVISQFINDLCNFGGVEGVKMLNQEGIRNIQTAVEMLKIVEKLPQGAELPNEDILIDWFLRNNDLQVSIINPANKSQAHYLMKQLAEQVLLLLKTSDPAKVLNKYTTALNNIKLSSRLTLAKKHILFNQLHHGATLLLQRTLTSGSLANVLVGPQNPLLLTIINDLKATILKKSSKKKDKWVGSTEIQLAQSFQIKDIQSVKDVQVGKGGSKTPAFKLAITQKHIKMSSQSGQSPTKFVIGFCLNDHAQNKTAILPSRVEVFGGHDKTLLKIGEMIPIEDQYYLSYGVRLFGIDLNSGNHPGVHSLKNLQFRLHQPRLCSTSQVLENSQKTKKGATFNISFISVYGFDKQPTQQPDYTIMYMTLLGFLGQRKYEADLKTVISSSQYDQKLQLIIQVLNDLLPDKPIEQLLLALNREGQNVLQHILKSKGANSHLVNRLLLGKLTKDNINKLLVYTLQNISAEFVKIITMSLRLASYSQPTREPSENYSDFDNIKLLLEKYQNAKGTNKELFKQIITSLLTVPNLYRYDISKLVTFVWSSEERSTLYSILAATLPFYPSQLQNCYAKNYWETIIDELRDILRYNQDSNSAVRQPFSHLELLSTLILNNKCRQEVIKNKTPIDMVQTLRSSTSILIQYPKETMRLLINFFQTTCIGTACQDQFSQILIQLMTSINDFSPIYHNYFIHSFFFPLINAFRGIPLIFIWKSNDNYLKQVTDILQTKPIRTNSKVIIFDNDFYHPIQSIDESNLKHSILFVEKETQKIAYKLSQQTLLDIVAKKQRKYQFKQGKVLIQISSTQKISLQSQKYRIYEDNEFDKNLLTNTTLLNMQNPWILSQQYQGIQPIKEATLQRCYFVPQQMKINQLLKQINIGGFKIHSTDLDKINVKNYFTRKNLTQDTCLRDIIKDQEPSFLKLEIEASQLFQSTTIETLVQQQPHNDQFVPQQTIFKAFEEKKGLEKMIIVLKGCVKNWSSSQQSNIWGQYLKELQSYSCFPVFSSLYINKKGNVGLLFDILLSLPDKQDSKKWLQKEKQSVKELYMIIKDVFAVKGQHAKTVRQYALKSGFYSTMLQRLHLVTKQIKRVKIEEVKIEEEDEMLPSLEKKESEEEFKMRLEKKQGVGYGTDSSSNQKWDVTGHQEAKKEKSEQILGLLKILEQFLDCQDYEYPSTLLGQTFESCLLPVIQSSLRGGSLLQISKYAELFQGELDFIQILAKKKDMVPTLLPLPKNYQPNQPQSLFSLIKTLANTSKIFLSALTGSASQKVSQEIAKKIMTTFEIVEQAVSYYEATHKKDDEEDKAIMELPLPKKYPILMKDLRFDYVDMKDSSNKITKHHYASHYQAGHKPPVDKTVRLAQELADISNALPIDHTNAIYVRCDKERVDFMQALIMGSNGTPYGHGAYLFDIYFEDSYPTSPPKVNLMTTGSGQVRFNPNLYACGKVCLSLLGTWRGQAMENWDAKVSTLLQVLVSIQSIIMSEDIYFNEPGFEHEQGTPEGQKKNQAYANIVRYSNIKFAMLQNIKKPPKGFESVIRRHFYLKKDEIMQECRKWLKIAQKRQASYNGLISDHNYNWCNTFKKSKTQYKTMLEKIIKELETELNNLPPPTHSDFQKDSSPKKSKKKAHNSPKELKEEVIEEIDMSYGQAKSHMELDINDEKVKDRWSRYIGAMGVQAVTKQSKASIGLLGLGALGVEIAKNIVLSGCKQLAVWDDKTVKYSDLSGQFFLSEEDVNKPRLEGCFYKLQQLNYYVKMTKLPYNPTNFQNLKDYQLIIATQRNHDELIKLNNFCRENKIYFICVDCYGPYARIFNDFGDKFQILDKDGEETNEVLIEQIINEEKGVVKVPKGQRHPFSDGDTVRIQGVKGMKSTEKEQLSINGSLHVIKVINSNSFEVGDLSKFTVYEGEGAVRQVKTIKEVTFKSLQDCSLQPNIEENLQYYDWAKSDKLKLVHMCFLTLTDFIKENLRLPLSWDTNDADTFMALFQKIKPQLSQEQNKFVKLFSFTCSGTFGSICAFFGGITAQEAFKAITGKYTPINQFFIAQFSEIIQTPPTEEDAWNEYVAKRKPVGDRTEGLRIIVGADLLKKLQNSKTFMIGSGAIGCELLKNFAMLQLGAGEEGGSIVVTDPDHIQNSNLNRQFLFREKHLQKPKSVTAAAAAAQMNSRLKGHIKPRLEKVCQATKQIFSNEFFQNLTIVANALDNVEARRYVDSRCVQNKVALLQSGTLSSKGHVQVIIPYKTESYGNMQDPNDAQGDIPHCTLKMFPQQTLHCVEWARDLFGKQFTMGPKALRKLLEEGQKYVVGPSDIQMLRQCLKLLENKPHSFDDAVFAATEVFFKLFRNDIMQLLYTYPLDAKTKDGKPFWKLPKRPPTPIEAIDPLDTLHSTFVSSYAVLLCKVYNVPYPKDFREGQRRIQIAKTASLMKVDPFVPSDKAAKQMAQQVNNQDKKDEQEKNEAIQDQNEHKLFENFLEMLVEIKETGETVESKPQEFEKDDDQNGHIDLIYSMANLRAQNYTLEEMDWITVKLKAGRIMPALSTTTSCIAALQSIQLVKYLKGCPVDSMRNSFLNLAVPVLTMGQPGVVQKIKVHQQLQTNIWQRWSIGPLQKSQTIKDIITTTQDKYKVIVKGLTLAEGGQIYSDIVLSLQSKKQQKQKLFKKSIQNLINEETGDENCKFIDMTLVMGVGQTLVKHAPTLRLLLTP